MSKRLLLFLLLLIGPNVASAQEPPCTLYKVSTSMLHISTEAGGRTYFDIMEDGEITCITRQQRIDGSDGGYISHKLKSTGPVVVKGWAASSPASSKPW